MMMTYTTVLTCEGCKGTLRFENERPDWLTYDYRVEQADECEKSAKFVADHIDTPLPEYEGLSWQPWEDAGRPKFIFNKMTQRYMMGARTTLEFWVPEPYLYVACPVCDSHVKKPYMKGPE